MIVKYSDEEGNLTMQFANIMDDFTHNFNRYFFSREYVKNLMWNLCFPGFFYCPIDRKTFLQGKYLQNGIFMEFENEVKHMAIFHEEFYVSSTLDNASSQTLYSYLVGCSEAQRDDRSMKCLGYNELSKNTYKVKKESQQEVLNNKEEMEESDFCRINPSNSFTYVSKTLHGFVLGPHNFAEESATNQTMDNFAPVVHFKNSVTG
jgi:hypothetical protein